MSPLPRHQFAIAQLVAQGYTARQIAEQRYLSVRTVELYIERAAKRLPGPGKPRHRLTLWWLTEGLELTPP